MSITQLRAMSPKDRIAHLKQGGASADCQSFADGNSKVGAVKVVKLFTPLAAGFKCGPEQESEREALAVAQEFIDNWDGVLPDE